MVDAHSLARKLERRVVAQWERELKARGLGSPLSIFVEFDWCSLSGDVQRIIFSKLCNVLDPRVAVAFSSVTSELWALTQAERQQLRADHEVAAVFCRVMGLRSTAPCKVLRETNGVSFVREVSSDDLALFGTLGSVLPALEYLRLCEKTAAPDGVQRLAEKLGAGALPALTSLSVGRRVVDGVVVGGSIGLQGLHVGDAGAWALAAALGRGAMPRLKRLTLFKAAIGDAGLVALAPALRRLPALEALSLEGNPLGDEGLAALVAPPPPAGAPPTTTGVLTKLKTLDLNWTQITDAGCATLAAAIESGTLPAFKTLVIGGIPASSASWKAVRDALPPRREAQEPWTPALDARRFSALALALDRKIQAVMKSGLLRSQA